MIDFDTVTAQVRVSLDQGEAQTAFQQLLPLLAYPGHIQDQTQWIAAFSLFAEVARQRGDEALAAAIRGGVEEPDNPSTLYDLGYELYGYQLHEIAATVLARAYQIDPQEQILVELVGNLENMSAHRAAVDYLRAAPQTLERNFFCRYLLAFNNAMLGDLNAVREMLPSLAEPDDDEQAFMAARLRQMLTRADAVKDITPLDANDLQGWHFVLTGGLLLHLSPFGEESMRGRYAFIQDSEDRCLEGLRRLVAVLEALAVKVPRVYALPDQASGILAQATGQVLRCPVLSWPDAGTTEPGLVVAYDMLKIESDTIWQALQNRHPGQLLWSHAACWTQELPYTADFTTFLYQYNVSPWDSHIVVDPETKKTRQSEPVRGGIEELAEQLLAATLPDEALNDLPKLIALAKAAHSSGAAFEVDGRRERQWIGGPVWSSRFY